MSERGSQQTVAIQQCWPKEVELAAAYTLNVSTSRSYLVQVTEYIARRTKYGIPSGSLSILSAVMFSCWRHQMKTFSALLAHCAGNSQITGEFIAQRPVMRSFAVFFNLHLNKRLSEQPWGRWFEMPSRTLWRYGNVTCHYWLFCDIGLSSTVSKQISYAFSLTYINVSFT